MLPLGKKQHNMGTEQERVKRKSRNNGPVKFYSHERAPGMSDLPCHVQHPACPLRVKVILIPCVPTHY